jgi:hypothetical protein
MSEAPTYSRSHLDDWEWVLGMTQSLRNSDTRTLQWNQEHEGSLALEQGDWERLPL